MVTHLPISNKQFITKREDWVAALPWKNLEGDHLACDSP
jgi:hypothetical protein